MDPAGGVANCLTQRSLPLGSNLVFPSAGYGTALFTWEFALGEYLLTKGIQFGSDETLNQFMFPREDERGTQDAAWLAGVFERAQAALRSIRFDEPDA